jgi:SWI/SNF-related matrix-associated actin-dependent regulator 1 of chromatin subfamily A
MSSIFFICNRCKEPGFEVPYYGGSGIYHKTCQITDDFLNEPQKNKTTEPTTEPQAQKQVAKITLSSGVISIDHPYDISILNEYRKYPGLKWNGKTKKREIRLKSMDDRTAHFLINEIRASFSNFDWLIDEAAEKEIRAKLSPDSKNEVEKIEKVKESYSPDIDFSYLKIEPFGYQKAGIAFLEATGGIALIGDDMGLGKTMTAIGYFSRNNLRTIVVTTASLKFNWKNEVEKFSNKNATVLDETTTQEEIKKTDVLITNYDQLKKWEALLSKAKFDCVVLDESHYISNVSSARTKYVFKLFKKIKHRILLSGTPIKNRPMELYSQLKFLHPEKFSNKMDFGFRYCGPTKGYNGYWEFKGSSNLDELNSRIQEFYIRRKKTEVLKDLPEKRVSNVIFELPKELRKEYNQLLSGKRDELRLERSKQKKEAGLIELMKYCSNKKVDFVEEFVKNQIKEDLDDKKKVIIFAHFRETQKELKKRFGDIAVTVFGDDSAKERQSSVERFQSDDDVRVFIGSTLAAGTGLTLTAADTVIFADLIWVPAELKQAESRAHRYGQKNSVFVYYLTFNNTIEYVVWKTIQSKLGVVSATLGDDEMEIFDSIYREMID